MTKTLTTAPNAALFRTQTTREIPARVDRKARIIYGANLMQLGDINDKRPYSVDQKTLQQAEELASRSGNGLKARYTHPNMSNDGMGSYLGRWKNLRIEGDKLRGDLHIADAAFNSPQGDLATYVMDLAESDPEAFGVSLATALDNSDLRQWENGDSDDKPERWPMRFQQIRAGDIVDDPAATRGGLFSMDADLRNLPAQATALLHTYFGDAPESAVRARIDAFLSRYFANQETPTVSTDTAAPEAVETPDEEIELAGVEDLEAGKSAEESADAEPVAEVAPEAPDAAPVDAALSVDAIAAERDRVKQIRVLCDLAGQGDKFSLFVDAGFSVTDTQAALRDLTAKRGRAIEQAPQPEADPDAKYRAEFSQHREHITVTESEYIRSRRIDDGLQKLN